MKNSLKIIATIIFLFSIGVFTGVGQESKLNSMDKQPVIEVYDFHTTNRCVTCKAIEANTKYTLETYFAEELKSGKITFQVVNIDEKENFDLAKKFYASGTSLYLNVIQNGKEKQLELTQFAFMYGKDRSVFSKKLKEKISKQLKNS